MIENKMPQTWFDTDYATTKALIDSKVAAGGGGYSPEAQAVIDRMTAPTEPQQDAIAAYVDAEVTNGNWADTIELQVRPLGAVNGLIGWKNFNATNNGATFDANGAVYNGTSAYIDSGLNALNDISPGVQDNIAVGSFCHTNNDLANTTLRALFGVRDAGTGRTQITQAGDTTAVSYGQYTASGVGNVGPQALENLSLFLNKRTDSANSVLFKNAVGISSTALASAAPPSLNYYEGARNNNGTADIFFDGKISFSIWYNPGTFDRTLNYNNLVTLLTSLGAI